MWFGNMTIYQGVLTRTQNELALTVDESLAKASEEELKSVITICYLMTKSNKIKKIIFCVMCPLKVTCFLSCNRKYHMD
jgi:hypothetical protein